MGLFEKIKQGLAKTANPIVNGINSLINQKKLDTAVLQDIEDILIMSDIGVKTASSLVSALSQKKFDKEITSEQVRIFLADQISSQIAPYSKPLIIDRQRKPFVIMMVGVNGAGKTTTIGKMASFYKSQNLKIRFAAADTFRAAAAEQLKVWAEKTNCPIVTRPCGADASGLVYDAIQTSIAEKDDILFIDTAGRLQNKSELMQELKKIERTIKKILPEAPHACLQVLDATVGQNAHSQVKIFSEIMNISGLILTKLDGTAKGGVLVSLTNEFRIPVHLIGVGEQIGDLQQFDPSMYAYSMMGLKKGESL